MLLSTLLYVGGLAQFGLAYADGLRQLSGELAAAGTDTAALWAALSSTRYDIAQPMSFVLGDAALVADPPLPTQQWYGALAALVVVPIVLFGINRAWRATRPYKWVSINELVGSSLALAIAAAAFGGVLLAGALVMPFVFMVIIKHTHKAKNFRPSYLYVLAVSTPLAGFALDYAGAVPYLYVDLLTLVFPVLAVVVLLLSAFVRPRVMALF
ncbi:hypothetical protein [Haloarchaeobius amylolyticus]|uniref:hypothetical protein n=1 Tax=Haloarchaeobius amylolyticus TaxID=1198296 RepID=UPI0022708120|nr:hypothetical protein [Haloarchaeobius amylolyticus]